MSDELFNVPESLPPWKKVQERHEIATAEDEYFLWTAEYTQELGESTFSASVKADTEKAAVTLLVIMLKLDGWQNLSTNA